MCLACRTTKVGGFGDTGVTAGKYARRVRRGHRKDAGGKVEHNVGNELFHTLLKTPTIPGVINGIRSGLLEVTGV